MIALRPIQPADDGFLLELYATTRASELSLVDWTETQKQQFLAMQFDAQTRHYGLLFPHLTASIILSNGAMAGRLLVDRSETEIRVVDISLKPEYCNAGIGTFLLHQLIEEGDLTAKPIRLHVEVFNPARRLYQRLGFHESASDGVYISMERVPQHLKAHPNTDSNPIRV